MRHPREWNAQQAESLLRLVIGVLFTVALLSAAGYAGPLALIAGVIASILLHEAGHLVAAKASGMKVTEYFVGFGTRLWSMRKGETEYGVKAIPAGGYCRIVGMNNLEEVDPGDEARTYRQQSYPKRMVTVLAGVVIQFALAFVLLWGLHAITGVERPVHDRLVVDAIDRLESGPSPAQEAGLRPADEIVAVDGRPIDDATFVAYVRQRPGSSIDFTIVRDGVTLHRVVVPADLSKVRRAGDEAPLSPDPRGFIGVEFANATRVTRANPVAAVGRASGDVALYTKATFGALGRLLSFKGIRDYTDQLRGHGAVTPSADQPRFLSPVGLVRVASTVSHNGVRDALVFLSAINIFIGILNALPLLPLDGGHAAVATYERIRSRRGRRYHVDAAKLLPVTIAFLALLGFIAVTSLYLDIARPLRVQ